jgi:uncharacterized RDD family membrane protein YckC
MTVRRRGSTIGFAKCAPSKFSLPQKLCGSGVRKSVEALLRNKAWTGTIIPLIADDSVPLFCDKFSTSVQKHLMSTSPNPNPYATPQASVGTSIDPSALSLASPWLRLAAILIDGIVLFPINYILQKMLFHMPSLTEQVEAARKGQDALDAIMPGKGILLLTQVIGIIVLVAVNFVFLKNGQTIGKKLLKLQIQNRSDGSLLPVSDLILKRVLPLYLVSALSVAISPLIGIIVTVDVLLIFRAGRNTLHDDLANSKVVKLPG